MKVDVLVTARLEFRDALRWYREQSATTARRFALEVKSAIAAIEKHPENYAQWGDKYRFYLVNRFPYYIAYRQTSYQVTIVAIRHAAQDQEAWLGR